MSRHTLNRAGININRLAEQLGATTAEQTPPHEGEDSTVLYLRFLDGNGQEVDLDDGRVQQAVENYTPPPPPDEDTQLAAIRAKAKEVAAGTGTFTAAQVQKILANLVLRNTR